MEIPVSVFYFQLSIICALFVYMLDYGLGKPADEKFSIKELLFPWSFYLAKRRLKKLDVLADLEKQHYALIVCAPKEVIAIATNNFKHLIFSQGRQYFTYEMILGMCPICTGFWITMIIFATVNFIYFPVNIFIFGFYFLLSHLFLRILKKFV